MSISQKVRQKIKRMPIGKPFTSSQFLEIGSRAAVDQALSRLVKAGGIARIRRGIFVKPEINRYSGEVLPGPEIVAMALAKASGTKLQVHGAEATRRFGLATQTPVKSIFHTSGPSKRIRVGRAEVELRQAAPRKLVLAGRPAGEALSALWYLGENEVTPEVVAKIRNQLPPSEFEALLKKKSSMPEWMNKVVSKYQAEERLVA